MRFLLRVWAIVLVVLQRLFSQRGMVLATLLGLVASVSLTLSVPLYADAVYYRVFRENIPVEEAGTEAFQRPPFSFLFHYFGGWSGQVQWEQVEPADQYLQTSFESHLGLPQKLLVRFFRTEPMKLYPADPSLFDDKNALLDWVSIGFFSDFEDHITLIDGSYPSPAPSGESHSPASSSEGNLIEVLVSEEFSQKMGLQVGESYVLLTDDETEIGHITTTQFPLRIAGVWIAKDPTEEYWIFGPNHIRNVLLTREESFVERVSPYLADEVYSVMWYFVMDGTEVHANDVSSLLGRIAGVEKQVDTLLPYLKLSDSPKDNLLSYQRAAWFLTILLYAFSVPILGLFLAFINLVSGLTVERRRNEIAVLRSRGATTPQILGIVLLESIVLGLIALGISAPLALQLAQTIGQTRSFLDFSAAVELRVGLTSTTFLVGLVAIGIALLAQVFPAIGAARHTIVTYKQEQARLLRPPWWQRIGLDVILFIPAAYGTYLLRKQGTIVVLESTFGSDPFENPLLFLVPALGIFSLALFLLRLIQPLMAGVSWIAAHTRSVGLLLASRYLARTRGFYTAPLILLILTLSLSAYTASLAKTLDTHLHDQIYYQVGADMDFYDLGESTDQSSSPYAVFMVDDDEEEGPRWLFFPVSEYLKVPGVRGAARVGQYSARPQLSSGWGEIGEFIGIDRLEFPKVAFWRSDFAPESLGGLMNRLAAAPNGVLVPGSFLRQHRLNIGDPLRLIINTAGQRNEIEFEVVGSFELFPTWYPDEGSIFVGNLDYVHEMAGSQFPYRVWLSTESGVDHRQIGEEGLREVNARVFNWKAAPLIVSDIQGTPERQGLFGLLSVGFLAAAVLTVLGFLLYSLFSFRRRFIEFGVLRASGLSTRQMTSFLAWELIALILIGGGAGTAIGAWVSSLFIPFLQIGTEAAERYPPYRVEVAWSAIFQVYALFGVLFVITLVVLVWMLRRMRIFQAIKLGETV